MENEMWNIKTKLTKLSFRHYFGRLLNFVFVLFNWNEILKPLIVHIESLALCLLNDAKALGDGEMENCNVKFMISNDLCQDRQGVGTSRAERCAVHSTLRHCVD